MESLFLHLGCLVFSAICAVAMFGPIAVGVMIMDRKGMVRHDDE